MFSEGSSLKELNLANFNINYVIDMRYMLFRCKLLNGLDLT